MGPLIISKCLSPSIHLHTRTLLLGKAESLTPSSPPHTHTLLFGEVVVLYGHDVRLVYPLHHAGTGAGRVRRRHLAGSRTVMVTHTTTRCHSGRRAVVSDSSRPGQNNSGVPTAQSARVFCRADSCERPTRHAQAEGARGKRHRDRQPRRRRRRRRGRAARTAHTHITRSGAALSQS